MAHPPVAIVGIGASAGGLEALEALFRNLPPDTGLGFVIVTHLARGHVSALPEIIARFTPMHVQSAEDGVLAAADQVYVCPADHILTIASGRLELHPRSAEVQRKPVDVFLASLAQSQGEYAIGILLSGSGTDGTLGLKAIKERGGITVVQGSDGSAPQHSGMPTTAIASGVVDLVLPVEQIGAQLATIAKALMAEPAEPSPPVGQLRQEICELLLNQVGHDFSGYKQLTFMRRVRRRMQMLQIASPPEYVQRLRSDADEVKLLFRDLLIGVTNFFRDPSAFQALAETVVPKLFEGKGADDMVRVWVPGCASGEEVYSIAILLREHMDKLRNTPKVQIFATDIDDAALNVARAGRYPAPLMDGVSPERRNRFFTGDDVTYAVTKEIRDLCMFSSHSVLRDPPFSRIDLISCRNLLIYFGTDFQARVMPIFHFALRPSRFLFLGTSENVSQGTELFEPLEKRYRIFRRRDNVYAPLHFSRFATPPRIVAGAEPRPESLAMVATVRRDVDARIMDRFAPAHVVVNRDGDILHYSGRTGRYLEPAAGQPNRQLMAMARRGLRLDIRAALRDAIESRRVVERSNIAVESDDRVQNVHLTIEPFGDNPNDPLFLVVFEDMGPPKPAEHAHPHFDPSQDTQQGAMERLEAELRDTRERLQGTVEEYETSVEELKSSNEELQSINEELQSTNEELETSKEELQSVNEELQTVNLELNAKIEELDRAHADLRNVFDSTGIAIVFLDPKLVIRSFTPAATSIFKLIPSDRGRPLTDIVSHVGNVEELRAEIEAVFASGQPVQRRVKRADGSAHYLMRVVPYMARSDAIDGVLVTFVDVTSLIEAEEHQKTLVGELNHRVRNMLTIVGAIAKQTLAYSKSNAEFTEAFLGRLNSMARSYTLVSRENWLSVSMREIFTDKLQDYDDRVELKGPDVACRPSAALALGLVIHELTTNAQKYGALANEKGRLNVAWDYDHAGDWLLVEWREIDGPPVPEQRQAGFGTRLIDRELESALGASLEKDFRPEGLVVTFRIPMQEDNFVIDRKAAAQ